MLNKLYELKENILSKKIYIIILLLVLIVIISLIIFSNKTDPPMKDSLVIKDEVVEDNKDCMVDIKGQINNSGLYKVSCDSRINDIIELAGGLTDNADTSVINLSKKIKDEMVIVIYSNEEVNDFINTYKKEELLNEKCKTASTVTNDACISKEDRVEVNVSVSNDKEINNSNKMISINYATKEELMTLSGIGESKALAIIKYREENGPFTNIEDLKNISGIGDKMFDKIKDSITL